MVSKTKFRKLLTWISFLFCNIVVAQSNTETYNYANNCYKNGDYINAISAYSRLVFFDKENYAAQCYKPLAEAYYKQGNYELAANFFNLAYNTTSADSLKYEYVFMKTLCHIKQNNFDYALIEIYSLPDSMSGNFMLRKNLYEATIYYFKNETDKAKEVFEKVFTDARINQQFKVLYKEFCKKNKLTARRAKAMSFIIPGLGQAYAGDAKNSINSLLLTSSFVVIYIAVASTVSPIEAVIGILPWFQRYYQGGVKHAGLIAEAKKENVRKKYYTKLLDLYEKQKIKS